MRSGYDRIGRSVTIEHAKRSCLDKRPYQSRNMARDAAAKNLRTFGTATKPYRCTLCGLFHLTTIRPRGKDHAPTRKPRQKPEQS